MNKKKWYVIYTRPNAEKKLEQRLLERGFDTFLPMNTVTRIWSDRKKVITEPLFKSYVFVYSDLDGLHQIKTFTGFSHFLRFGAYPVSVPESQITLIKSVTSCFSGAQIMASNFIEGDQVTVINGPLKGMEGVLVEVKGEKKVALEIRQLEQSMLITIPPSSIVKKEVVL